MSHFLEAYEIVPIEISGVTDTLLLPVGQYATLKRFAAFGGVAESAMAQPPQFLKNASGYNRFVYLSWDDFQVLSSALPDPDNLFRSAPVHNRKEYDAWGSLLDNGSFLVYQESKMATPTAQSLDSVASAERRRLIETSRVEPQYQCYRLKHAEPFSTPALAASVIAGYNVGIHFWSNYFDESMPATRQ